MNRWKKALLTHYTAPMKSTFQQFRLGVVLFFLGLVCIYIATQLWPPSMGQELIIAVGLMCAGTGFIYALLAQTRMLISRFVVFFTKK